MIKTKVQVRKDIAKPKASFLDVSSDRDTVIVTITVEAESRQAGERVMAAVAEFTEKLSLDA